jgi:protein tyrosine kinase modulator
MRRFNLNGPQEILALLVRRKLWILYPFLALSSAVLLLTYMLPKMYESKALILILPQNVPNDFVKDLLAGSTAQRLNAIEQTVLSRTTLLEILTEFRDRLPEYKNLSIEDQILNLRNRIDLVFNTIGGGGEAPTTTSFTIAYSNRSPEVAQKITDKVTSVFIKQDSQSRETNISGTVRFFKDQLEMVSSQLDASETKKKNLQAAHPNELPALLARNLAMLTTLTDQRRGYFEAIDRYQNELLGMDRQLAITEQTLVKPRPVVDVPPPAPKNPLLDEYVKAQSDLNALFARGMTANHPDVTVAQSTVARVKAKLTPDELASLDHKNDNLKPPAQPIAEEIRPNPAYVNLLTQKGTIENELKIRRDNLTKTNDEIERYEKYIQNAPQSEQAMVEVLRENTELTKQYQEVKDKLYQAQLSEDLETRQQGSQFKIQDPANLPLTPTKPAKPAIAAAGILFSLLFSIALAIIVDVANQKMWTMTDVEAILGATVLVEIPEIVTSADLSAGRQRKRIHLASFAVASVAYAACLYLVYVHQGFVMTHLDPLFRRLY